MTRVEQDKRWNDLAEKKKQEYRDNYNNAQNASYNFFALEYISLMNTTYGSHNLQPKPLTPKTWEDVDNNTKSIVQVEGFDTAFREILDIHINTHYLNTNFAYKIIATIQIAKLIDLGYGGMVTEKEWEDDNVAKYAISTCIINDKILNIKKVDIYSYNSEKYFIAFHTSEQREEFMSYPENVKLVEQYHMI